MLLEIITRHMSTRPGLLRRNQASLAALSSGNWIQSVLVDNIGRGIPWTGLRLRTFEPLGDYVWILDDDDECIMPTFAQDLETITSCYHPDVIVVRMDHGDELGILPNNGYWGQQLKEATVGCSAFVVSKATWMAHRQAWGERYAGDFDFVNSVQSAGCNLYWWDVVASRISKRNKGQGE